MKTDVRSVLHENCYYLQTIRESPLCLCGKKTDVYNYAQTKETQRSIEINEQNIIAHAIQTIIVFITI